jgi:hypothetical protein
MKIKLLFLSVVISITTHAQFSEEKILEDGSHYIVYTPRHYSEEELKNRKPRRIPTTAEVRKNPLIPLGNLMMMQLEKEFKSNIAEDSSLVAVSNILFLNHLGITGNDSENSTVRYHQIWELDESVVNYNLNDLAQSLVKMLKENHLDNYFKKTVHFYCKEYFYNETYYLVVLLDD